MEGVTVRKANVTDLPAIQRLFRQLDSHHADLLPQFFQPLSGDARSPELVAQAIEGNESAYLVAELQGQVVGFLSLRVAQAPSHPVFRPRRFVLIEDAVVDESHRGAGIGTALFNGAVAWAKEQGIRYVQTSVWEANGAAKAFYLGQGFRPTLVRMELDLEGQEP